MPRKILRRWLPNDETFRRHPRLRVLGNLLGDPNLWHLNRRSVSGAMAVGLFFAWVPLPLQMVMAALGAIGLRVNLPISVLMVWITNPITIPPMFYFAYRLGSVILRRPPESLHIELSLGWLAHSLNAIWEPLVLGSLVLAVLSALIGYLTAGLLWRMHVVRNWQARRRRRQAPAQPVHK